MSRSRDIERQVDVRHYGAFSTEEELNKGIKVLQLESTDKFLKGYDYNNPFPSPEEMATSKLALSLVIELFNAIDRNKFRDLYPKPPFPAKDPIDIIFKNENGDKENKVFYNPFTANNIYVFREGKFDPELERLRHEEYMQIAHDLLHPEIARKRIRRARWAYRAKLAAALAGAGVMVAGAGVTGAYVHFTNQWYQIDIKFKNPFEDGETDATPDEKSSEPIKDGDEPTGDSEIEEGDDAVPGGAPPQDERGKRYPGARAKAKTTSDVALEADDESVPVEIAPKRRTNREILDGQIAEADAGLADGTIDSLQCIRAVRTNRRVGNRPSQFLGNTLSVGDDVQMYIALAVPGSNSQKARYEWDYSDRGSDDVKWKITPNTGIHYDLFPVGKIPESAAGTSATFTVKRGQTVIPNCSTTFTISE